MCSRMCSCVHVFGGGLPPGLHSLLVLIRQLVIGPLIVVGPGASAQVSPWVKAAKAAYDLHSV